MLLSDAQIRSKDIDTLKRFIRHKLGGYVVSLNNIPVGHSFFRGVRCDDRPSTIDRISYPPVACVTKLGRANREGTSMFYCSVAAAPVFYEIRARVGDRIAVSRWEVMEALWMHHLGYHTAALGRMGGGRNGARPRLSNPIPNETKHNRQLRRELSLAFTEQVRDGDEYRYKRSIAINELLFDRASPLPLLPDSRNSSRAAGTVYPAVQMMGAADNAVFFPEFVDACMQMRWVGYAVVEAADEARLSYTLLTLDFARRFSGREILWEGASVPERERRSHIAFENGAWVMRDGWGRIYDWH